MKNFEFVNSSSTKRQKIPSIDIKEQPSFQERNLNFSGQRLNGKIKEFILNEQNQKTSWINFNIAEDHKRLPSDLLYFLQILTKNTYIPMNDQENYQNLKNIKIATIAFQIIALQNNHSVTDFKFSNFSFFKRQGLHEDGLEYLQKI